MVKGGGFLHRRRKTMKKRLPPPPAPPQSFAAYEGADILAKHNYENECRLCTQKNLGRERLECRKTYTITLRAQ
jgi:hypothetical protein